MDDTLNLGYLNLLCSLSDLKAKVVKVYILIINIEAKSRLLIIWVFLHWLIVNHDCHLDFYLVNICLTINNAIFRCTT